MIYKTEKKIYKMSNSGLPLAVAPPRLIAATRARVETAERKKESGPEAGERNLEELHS